MNNKLIIINKIKFILINRWFLSSIINKKNNFFMILFYYLGILFSINKSLYDSEIKYLLKNQFLFEKIIKLVDKEMIFNFSILKDWNSKNIFFYKYIFQIYIENYDFVIKNNLEYYHTWWKYILYTEKMNIKFHKLNEIWKELYLIISFNPYSESFVYEEACWWFRFEFYIIDSKTELNFKVWNYYKIDTDDYYACSFYVWNNDILVSGLQWSDIYIDYFNFRINNFFFNFVEEFKNIYNINNIIWLSNNIYFCKHHKNYNWDYDNIFKKYWFILNKDMYYDTKILKIKKINNYNYTNLVKKIYGK